MNVLCPVTPSEGGRTTAEKHRKWVDCTITDGKDGGLIDDSTVVGVNDMCGV
jgi:hypothetical protein